jgi:hypothetical protein
LERRIVLYKKLVLKKNEIIKIGDYKYVVYKFGKDSVELIPIDTMLDGTEESSLVPKIKVRKTNIKKYQKMDNYELLYLVNQKNPLIKEVIYSFLEKESKKR